MKTYAADMKKSDSIFCMLFNQNQVKCTKTVEDMSKTDALRPYSCIFSEFNSYHGIEKGKNAQYHEQERPSIAVSRTG